MKAFFQFCIVAGAILAGSGQWFDANASAQDGAPWSTIETHRVAESTIPMAADPALRERGIGRWYAGLHAGAVIQPDMQISGPGLEVDARQNVGYIFDVVFGYKFRFGFRLDTEFSYRNNDTEAVFFPDTKEYRGNGIGGAEAVAALLNGWYDFNLSPAFESWSPYIGGGLGYSKVWVDPGHSNRITVIDSSDSSLVWQGGAGLIYWYTADLQISIDYRYLRSIGELEFRDSAFPGTNDETYQTHSFMLGFRGFF